MKFQDFYAKITEAMTDVAYHATPIGSAIKILEQDKFKLTSMIGDTYEERIMKAQGANMPFYMSVARSASSPYVNDLEQFQDSYDADVIFVMDGRKFNHNHRTKAVDYGQGEYAYDYGNELEDRVFSKKRFIPKASSYINEIHVWVKKDTPMNEKLKGLAKEKNIPIYFYNDKKSWKTLNKIKAD